MRTSRSIMIETAHIRRHGRHLRLRDFLDCRLGTVGAQSEPTPLAAARGIDKRSEKLERGQYLGYGGRHGSLVHRTHVPARTADGQANEGEACKTFKVLELECGV